MKHIVIPIRLCANCGTVGEDVRVMRGRRFTIHLCDDCALGNLLVDEGHNNAELRVIAVAMQSLVPAAS